MFRHEAVKEHSDSLIGLLAEQCGDLERLLALARAETEAVEAGNFDAVLEIVTKRAALGERLEVFSRQVAELRDRLGETGEAVLQNPIAARTTEIVSEILKHDSRSRPLLVAAGQDAKNGLSKIESSQRVSSAYAREGVKGVAYSRNF